MNEVDQVYKISLDELIDNSLVLNTPINKSGFKINVPLIILMNVFVAELQ